MADFYRNVYGGMADGTIEIQKRGPLNQRGNGFFGRLIKGSLAPIIRSVLPYLKDMALEGVGGLVEDLKQGRSMKDAASNQFKRSASNLAEDVATRVKRTLAQSGSGLKRRRQARKRGAKKKEPTRQIRPKQRGIFPI